MSRKYNATDSIISQSYMPPISLLHQYLSKQHISRNVPPSHFLYFSRQGFTRPRLPVRWSSLGPPNTLSFSRRMCRSVVVDLFLLHRDGSMWLPEQASPLLSLSLASSSLQGLPTHTGTSMYVGGVMRMGWLGPDRVVLGLRSWFACRKGICCLC